MSPALLSLPPELRTSIYELVLLQEPPIFRFSLCIYPGIPALLQTNHQLRDEALGIYYGRAGFELIVHQRGIRHFVPWTKTIDRIARGQLLSNPEVNLRVVMDDEDPVFYIGASHLLSGYALKMPGGWYVTAENHTREREDIDAMFDVAKRRHETVEERAARKKVKEDQKRATGVAGGALELEKQALQVQYKEEAKVLLSVVTQKAYDAVMGALEV